MSAQSEAVRARSVTPSPDGPDPFHRVNDVLPIDQELVSVAFDTPVTNALATMKAKGYSQLPVMAGGQVLGIFSHRSFANKVPELSGKKVDPDQLPVGEFIEPAKFVHVMDDLGDTLKVLDKDDAILVGSRDRLQGILTTWDLVKHLYRISSPYILLKEIELALREIIRRSISWEKLQEVMKQALKDVYDPDDMPTSLEKMTVSDYAQVIGYGDARQYFQEAFGRGDYQRNTTRAKLLEVGRLRNDVFHFKRQLDNADIDKLVAHRDWIRNVLTALKEKRIERQL